VADASAVGRRKLRDRQLAEALRLTTRGPSPTSGCDRSDGSPSRRRRTRLALAAHAEGEHAPPSRSTVSGSRRSWSPAEDDEYVGSPAGLAAVIGASVALVPADHLGAVFPRKFKSAVVKFLE